MAGPNELRNPKHHVLAVLLEKIDQDPFPSTTQLDMVEQLLTPETTPVYVQVLLDKVRRDPFPSMDHLQRLISLV
jgi:hypothetical protein